MSAAAAHASPSLAEYRMPDGPRTPSALNGILFLLSRKHFTRRLQRRYGDAFAVTLPIMGRGVVVSNPELVKQVFTAKPDVLHGGKNPLGEVLGPGSLFSMDEGQHLKERRMLLPSFHGERMRSYDSLIEEEAQAAMAGWPDEEEFETLPAFNRITLRVILRAVFGAEGQELKELEALLPELTAVGQRLVTMRFLRRDLGPRSPGGRMKRLRGRYDQLVDTLIDQHLADPQLDQRIDILALMLTSLRDSREGIIHSDVADELMTLLVAGHETTASSLAWAVDRLSRHPHVLRRLEQEVAAGGSRLRSATVLEVQRTRPVIKGTSRVVMKPFDLGEWRLAPGTVIITEGALMHDDERFYPEADRFDPDRYLDGKLETYSCIPFGGGSRRCLGAAFALFEMEVVLRTLLRDFELQTTAAEAERDSFRGVAYAPKKRGLARLRRRAQPLEVAGGQVAAGCPVDHGAAA